MTALPPPAPEPLAFDALETVYETLALGIDRAGEANEAADLTKLAIDLANRAGAGVDFGDCVATALRNLGIEAQPLPGPSAQRPRPPQTS
ncbi:MAG: hypothetical protein Q8S29_15415 [Phreatobacter sp.]|nr:hypothetical protein [Phreatobacter sp.]